MNILILKEQKGAQDPYLLTLKEIGQTSFIPVLSISFLNLEQLGKSLSEDNHDGIIFSSGNSARATKAALELLPSQVTDTWIQKKCYVVGKATEKLASEIGFKCSGSSTGNAEELAKLIIKENLATSIKGFLFPCGQLKREILPKMLKEAGIELTCQTVYETSEHPGISEAILKYKTRNKEHTVAVYFSPSGVRFSLPKFKEICGEDLQGFHFASIGPTTSHALEQVGIKPCCVAEHPTPESLGLAIRTFLKEKNDLS